MTARAVTPRLVTARAVAARAVVLALAIGLTLGLTGCGGSSDQPAGVSGPESALQSRLDAVDRAISAGDWASARTAVNRLEQDARRAERGGDLSRTDAARIVSAGDRLLQTLPSAEDSGSPSGSPSASATGAATPTPTPTPTTSTPSPTEETSPVAPPGHAPKPPKPPKGDKPGHDKGPHGHGKH